MSTRLFDSASFINYIGPVVQEQDRGLCISIKPQNITSSLQYVTASGNFTQKNRIDRNKKFVSASVFEPRIDFTYSNTGSLLLEGEGISLYAKRSFLTSSDDYNLINGLNVISSSIDNTFFEQVKGAWLGLQPVSSGSHRLQTNAVQSSPLQTGSYYIVSTFISGSSEWNERNGTYPLRYFSLDLTGVVTANASFIVDSQSSGTQNVNINHAPILVTNNSISNVWSGTVKYNNNLTRVYFGFKVETPQGAVENLNVRYIICNSGSTSPLTSTYTASISDKTLFIGGTTLEKVEDTLTASIATNSGSIIPLSPVFCYAPGITGSRPADEVTYDFKDSNGTYLFENGRGTIIYRFAFNSHPNGQSPQPLIILKEISGSNRPLIGYSLDQLRYRNIDGTFAAVISNKNNTYYGLAPAFSSSNWNGQPTTSSFYNVGIAWENNTIRFCVNSGSSNSGSLPTVIELNNLTSSFEPVLDISNLSGVQARLQYVIASSYSLDSSSLALSTTAALQ